MWIVVRARDPRGLELLYVETYILLNVNVH